MGDRLGTPGAIGFLFDLFTIFLDLVEEATSLAWHVPGSLAIEHFQGTDKKYQTSKVTDIKVGFNSLLGFRISIWLGGGKL